MASAEETVEHTALPNKQRSEPSGISNNFWEDKEDQGNVLQHARSNRGDQCAQWGAVQPPLDHLCGVEKGSTAMWLFLDTCLGQAPWRTYSLIEPPGKMMTEEMKGSPDKDAWPISVYL